MDAGGLKEPLLDGGPDTAWEKTILREEGRTVVKYMAYRPRVAAMRPYVKLL